MIRKENSKQSTTPIYVKIAKLQAIANKGKIVRVSVDEIVFDAPAWIEARNNARKEVVKDAAFFALVADIQATRVKHNISLRLCVNPDERDYCLICVAGQRRVEAVREAILNLKAIGTAPAIEQAEKLAGIPATISIYVHNESALADSLVENLLRADLPFVDTAMGFNRLFHTAVTEGMTEKEARLAIATRFGKEAETIRLYIKAGGFPDKVLSLFRQYPEIFTIAVIFKHFTSIRIHTDAHIIGLVEDYLRENTEPVNVPVAVSEPTAKETEGNASIPAAITPRRRRKVVGDAEFQQETAKLARRVFPWAKVSVKGDRNKGQVSITVKSQAGIAALIDLMKRKEPNAQLE